jgi:hypothetical protein
LEQLLSSRFNVSDAPHLNNPKHWRGRAKEMRALAEEMNDLKSLSIMLGATDDYGTLADRAEERAKTSISGPSPIRE